MAAVRRVGKKTATETVPKTLKVRVRVSFNGMYAGEVSEVPDNRTVRGWIAAHYVEVIGGESAARSSGPDPDDSGSKPKRAPRGE